VRFCKSTGVCALGEKLLEQNACTACKKCIPVKVLQMFGDLVVTGVMLKVREFTSNS
jgi:hypothetical protein